MNVNHLLDVARQKAMTLLPIGYRVIAHLDDTLIRKKGKKIPGTAWRRDPLGPAFHTNFIWGQRFIQISMAVPQQQGPCQVRTIPIDFHHSPSIKKAKPSATEEQIAEFKKQHREAKLSNQGSIRINLLRNNLNEDGHKDKNLCISVDGSYTNHTVLKQLPLNTTLIGRIRKDSKLYTIPPWQLKNGRRKLYGQQMPTPEQIRQSPQYPYIPIKAWASGKTHDFKIKVINNLRWRVAGQHHDLQLVIISPLGYRLTKSSKILYRDPAYLICTDNSLNIAELIQSYLWRWEIEVNFRDQKTLLGCGQAQVRNLEAVEKAPAFCVAMYSFLHLSSLMADKVRDGSVLPRPKWDPPKNKQRLSTMELINLFRLHVWSKNSNKSFSGFLENFHKSRSLRNPVDPLLSAALFLRN